MVPVFPLPARRALAHKQLRLLARGQHALAHGQRHVEKRPLAQNVLQRPARRPLPHIRKIRFRFLFLRLLFAVQQQRLPVEAETAREQCHRVKGGAVHAGLRQFPAAASVKRFERHGFTPPTMSSPFSGMTSFMAAMATSIIESSGSFVVRRCIHSPGAATMRVARLS